MKINKLLLFLLILSGISAATPAWASTPAIFYSDLTAGPNTGGQNNYGVFVTIWGNNFGTTQGSSYITVGGGKVNNYPTWTNTEITFQLGSSAATGNIVLNTSNGNATGPAFTVQAGNIYFVQPGASSNGTGTYASPFNHLYYAEQKVVPGDVVYVEAGTIKGEIDGHPGWHTLLMPEVSGTQASPISWVAYPNASVILVADGSTATWTDGSSGGSDTVSYAFRGYTNVIWQTVSKFTLQMPGTNGISLIDSTGDDGWKVVGNNFTSNAYTYCQLCLAGNYSSALGNEIHDSGSGQSFNNEDHSIYWDGGGTNVEIGWNYIHDNQNSGWEISSFHQGSSSAPTRAGKIHDNLITNANGYGVKGILLGDVDSGENETDVEAQNIQVYNNVLYNLGENENGGAIQAVSGTAYIYNNTIYQSPDSAGTIQFPAGGIGPGGGHPVWYVANNIIYNSLSSSLYVSDGNGNAPAWTNFALLTNNNYYGAGNGPSQDAKAVNANPQFVAAGTNFQLQASSPDINAGYNTISVVLQDITGLIRSTAPSIGAYQYSSSSSTPTPVVSITSPTTGSTVTAGSNVSITASASETNGTISNIAIYSGSTLLGSSSSSPYTYVMNNPAVGTYTLTAVATDAKGVSTTSNAVVVTVQSAGVTPSSPAVKITSPSSGSTYTAGSSVTITTTASETNGTISNIYLYNGSGVLLGSSTSSPFNYIDSNMAAGGYSFYAVAKDANGVSTTSSTITITVIAAAAAPKITTQPVSTTVTAPSAATFSVTASGTPSPTYQWLQSVNGGAFTNISGATSSSYTTAATTVSNSGTQFECTVTNSSGSVTSNPAALTVNAAPSTPAVTLTSPSNNVTFNAPATIFLSANASETNGTIAQVQFFNGSTPIYTATSAPYNYTWASNLLLGSYTITAQATDSRGVVVTSAPVTVNIALPSSLKSSSLTPSVAITSPNSGSSITAGSSLNITASASESNGSIAVVYFYSGSTFIGSSNTSPYNFTWANVPAGTYSLTAKAVDTNGVSVTSSPVTVTAASTSQSAPVAAITSPANGSSITSGSNLTITASASETNGTIAQMQFYNGSTLLGTDSSVPYSYTWTSVAAGNYTLTVKATDTKGNSTTSSGVTVTVTGQPTVSITSPANGNSITSGSNLTITASASETNGTISEVYFYNGTTSLGSSNTSPYSYTWNNIPAGTYSFIAVAIDANGVSVSSNPVAVTVTAPAVPVVAITSPASGDSITTGSNLNITASASETNGTISQVQFYNGSTLLGTDTTSPYTYTWTNVPAGNYTLTAKATDAKGNSTTSSGVTVTVRGQPVVSIISPASGSNVTTGSNLNITASASETNGTIAQVQFYNGSTLLGTDTSSPYTYTWTNVPAGSYTLTAKATDTNGVSTTSSAVTFSAAAAAKPVVTITSPANGSTFNTNSIINYTASASETNGSIVSVSFYYQNNGTHLMTTDTSAPYSFNSSASAGTYMITAVATDANGVSTTSSPVTITVTTASSPVVAITSPANGSSITPGSNLTITASASETNGTIAQVQFYNGSKLLGTDTTSSYSYTWTNVPAGTYSITAKAIDTNGVSTTSAAITVTASAAPATPVVSITSPSTGSSLTLGSTVTITANASETNGTIAQVQFYLGNTLLYTATSPPYTYTWKIAQLLGSYNLTAQATDSKGVIVTSTPVTVTVTL